MAIFILHDVGVRVGGPIKGRSLKKVCFVVWSDGMLEAAAALRDGEEAEQDCDEVYQLNEP